MSLDAIYQVQRDSKWKWAKGKDGGKWAKRKDRGKAQWIVNPELSSEVIVMKLGSSWCNKDAKDSKSIKELLKLQWNSEDWIITRFWESDLHCKSRVTKCCDSDKTWHKSTQQKYEHNAKRMKSIRWLLKSQWSSKNHSKMQFWI